MENYNTLPLKSITEVEKSLLQRNLSTLIKVYIMMGWVESNSIYQIYYELFVTHMTS